MRALEERRLYLCTPDRPDLEPFLAACIRGGVDLVQLRDKGLEARPLLARVVHVAPQANGWSYGCELANHLSDSELLLLLS